MQSKNELRKKYFFIRKKNYLEIKPSFFQPLIRLIKTSYKKNSITLSSYYPASFEVNVLKIFQTNIIARMKILLPVVKGKNTINFYEWKKNDILRINQFGMLEPAIFSNHIIPDIMLVPLLAYDNQNNRLGYGGGFYDRYFNRYLKTYKNILTIGVAFSFQKHRKLPVFNNDVKLDYILTEKGII
jgi:5-formyltetrahydrofolate cyclo-ligase